MFKKIIFVLIVLLFCQNHSLFAKNNTPKNVYLHYSWDCTYYFRTNGARNSCGAEAWMTLTGEGDSIYAAKGTKKQFMTMKFSVEDALKMNGQLPDAQRLKFKENFVMVDFTKHKTQSLAGYINEDVFGLIILLPGKKGLFKLEGSIGDLKKLGFDVTASGNTGPKNKVQILQILQSKIWGIMEMDKNGKAKILMKKNGQATLSSVSIEEFISYGH